MYPTTSPGIESDTWGFNGDYLGPTLRAEGGERVAINVHNDLGEPTTAHWHGMHLPAEMDGGPHQMIDSGGELAPTWEINQPAIPRARSQDCLGDGGGRAVARLPQSRESGHSRTL
jgi:FtsP/CotA-like multicopper oxidase with cupredoxin domain